MKLEKNMYVRTKEGIRKIEDIYEDVYELNKCLHYNYPEGHDLYEEDIKEVVIKAGFELDEVIEVGDIIEVNNFEGKYEVRQFGFELSIVKDDKIYNLNSLFCTLNIKSIVTKEQFEQMQYKVGE